MPNPPDSFTNEYTAWKLAATSQRSVTETRGPRGFYNRDKPEKKLKRTIYNEDKKIFEEVVESNEKKIPKKRESVQSAANDEAKSSSQFRR